MTESQKTFIDEFMEHLIHIETNNRFSLSEYFANTYSQDYPLCNHLPFVLCSQSVSVSAPFSYEMQNLNAFCMLHTTKGIGRLEYDGHTYELSSDAFVFFDCRKPHKLTCPHNLWEYSFCYVSGDAAAFYYDTVCSENSCFFQITPYTNLLSFWNQLLNDMENTEAHALLRSRTLVMLFTELFLLRASAKSDGFYIPGYLLDIKKRFDTSYDKPFSLDELASKYHISKYRLCREFSQYFQETPLHYLNRVRVEEAKKLLLNTDEKICVVGQLVGIENTNHFIRLFKEKTGVTPLHFRKETPVP